MADHFQADSKVQLLSERQEKKKEGDCTVDIKEENQNQNLKQNQEAGKHISRVSSALVEAKPDAYKPKLISIGPYHMEDPGLEKQVKRVKQDLQNSLFKNNGFKEQSTKRLTELKDKARSWYATDDTLKMKDEEFVNMLLLDACFILEFLEKYSKKEVTDEFMKVKGNLVQTLIDMTLLENQIPFFVLFELFKLKHSNANKDDGVLLQKLIVLVKTCIGTQVPKLTPRNIFDHGCKPQPDALPKHLVEVVHNLCIPRNAQCGRHGDCCNDSGGKIKQISNECGRIIEQINTATELEKDGVEFKKVGKVYERYFEEEEEAKYFDSKDSTTMFDLEFSNGTLKIPSFKIDDGTETLLRNMIAYEQHSTEVSAWFSDFASFMDQLIEDTPDVNLLRRRGIIVNCMAQDKMVSDMFKNLCQDVINYNTFSGVIRKVNLHSDNAWNVWFGKLRHDLSYSPWKLISAVAAGLVVTVTTASSLRNILR